MAISPEPDHRYLKCITNSKQICNHPLNLSQSKQQWSFPHQERIPRPPKYSQNPVGYHDINYKLLRSTFAVDIGKGKKCDLPMGAKDIPGPNTYYPPNLNIGASSKRGFSFGLSRDRVPPPVLGHLLKNASKLPGPGAYEPKLWKSGRNVTFKIRLDRLSRNRNTIGPGDYPMPPVIQGQKRCYLSTIRNTASPKYPPVLSAAEKTRVGRPMSENKGAALTFTCDTKYQINTKGNFFNSKYPNSTCKLFDKEERLKVAKPPKEPGPGSYLLPSEFGVYQSSKA